jgi:hypothetical protein
VSTPFWGDIQYIGRENNDLTQPGKQLSKYNLRLLDRGRMGNHSQELSGEASGRKAGEWHLGGFDGLAVTRGERDPL